MIFELTIPKETLETTPVRASYDVGRRILKNTIVRIPDGHKYLARLQVQTQGRRIYPDNSSGVLWIRGNNNTIVFSDPITLEGPPFEITLLGFNEDDTFQHTFYIEVA